MNVRTAKKRFIKHRYGIRNDEIEQKKTTEDQKEVLGIADSAEIAEQASPAVTFPA